MSMRAMVVAVLGSLLALPFAAGAEAGGTESDTALFGRDPGDGRAFACYVRHYDDAHLKAHPKQNVRNMMLFVDSQIDSSMGRTYSLTIGVSFRKIDHELQVSGGCDSSVDGKAALNCGIDCDGGRIDVNVRDANSILVSIPDGVATWDPQSADETPDDSMWGADDKLFRLDRTSINDCLPLVWDDDAKAMIQAIQ